MTVDIHSLVLESRLMTCDTLLGGYCLVAVGGAKQWFGFAGVFRERAVFFLERHESADYPALLPETADAAARPAHWFEMPELEAALWRWVAEWRGWLERKAKAASLEMLAGRVASRHVGETAPGGRAAAVSPILWH